MLRVTQTLEGSTKVLALHGSLDQTDLALVLRAIAAGDSRSVRLDLAQLRAADGTSRRALVDLETKGDVVIEPVNQYMALLLERARAELVGPLDVSPTKESWRWHHPTSR